jgi:hypothetical protein
VVGIARAASDQAAAFARRRGTMGLKKGADTLGGSRYGMFAGHWRQALADIVVDEPSLG